MKEPIQPSPEQRLQAVHCQALSIVDQLQALTSETTPDRLPGLLELINQMQEVVHFLAGDTEPAATTRAPTRKQRQEFGRLLRDRRSAAGFSRLQLARRAKLSDATIKFIETARHPPSRATLIRLLGVAEIKLTWSDVPGSLPPPPIAPAAVVAEKPLATSLNCLLTSTFDPVRRVTEMGRFLNGAGGHLDPCCVYLEHQSAAAYLALCQQSAVLAGLRASTPLAEAAQCIVASIGPVALQVIALGSGSAQLEVRLVQHVLELGRVSHLDLCLLDISQPLLACGQKHAAETFTAAPKLQVWGMQCDFHELPLYNRLLGSADVQSEKRRLFCMLGETFAHLDHEPRFLQHSLPSCARGDLLLLDMRLASAPATDPEQIKQRDQQWAMGVTQAEAAWLSGPLWRYCEDVVRVEFHWELDTHLPLPGSYALGAVATVHGKTGAARRFSTFRYRRYALDPVAACLQALGWEELNSWPFGGAGQPSSLRLFRKRTEPPTHE